MKQTAITRSCLQCSARFETTPSRIERGGGKYCSKGCAGVARNKRIENACAVCGKPFYPARYLQGTQRACSIECAKKLRVKKRKCVCVNCGAEFFKAASQFKFFKGAGKYCSRKCTREGTVKANADKPSTDRWNRTGRHADRVWQKAVREKDKYTCQRCGKVERYIHAHHVAPRSRRPDLKHEVSNGKCLCNSCHTWVHRHPIEATALGLLSDASYEKAQKQYGQKQPCRICGRPQQGHGLCDKHYARWRKYGDPLITRRAGHPRPGEQPFRETQ